VNVTVPGPTLGVVGGGQLGRMMGEAAAALGVELVVLDPTPGCPASQVATDQIVGDFDDADAIHELAARADALTFEIELADPDALAAAAEEHDVPVHPDPDTLRTIQDKLVQTEALADAGIPVPEFAGVATAEGLELVVEEYGGAMVKARRGGYDGRGNLPLEPGDDPEAVLEELGTDAMAERLVDFEREVSVIGVAGADGVRTYPTTETLHREQILRESVTPARSEPEVAERAQSVARNVLSSLEGRGVYGIELFETREGEILVNEIAPRPHNSGHWTIEGAATSQFENHVRATLGWPLGPTDLVAPTVTANVLGDTDDRQELVELNGVEDVLAAPDASMHWYGKDEVYPLRKMGHVTAAGDRLGPEEGAGAVDGDALDDLLASTTDLRDGLGFTEE